MDSIPLHVAVYTPLMTRAAHRLDRPLGLGALFALLALMVGILSPPGFMVATRGKVPTVVICTGHGPAAVTAVPGAPDRSGGKTRHDGGACPFAGHGVAAPITLPSIAITLAFAPSRVVQAGVADLTPGRGLAAPPPPSHAPPALT